MASVEVTKKDVLDLHRAIKQDIMGREEPIKDDNGKTLGAWVKPFKLSLKSRYAMAITLKKIDDHKEVIDQLIRQKRLENYRLAQKETDEAKKPTNFDMEIELADFLKEKIAIEVHKVSIVEFHLSDNEGLLPSTIAALYPMLDIPDNFGS